jgi:alpha-1,2-mannosyltransferase
VAKPETGASAPSLPTAPANWPVYRLVALAFATIVVISIPVSTWVYRFERPGVDFVSFWAAGRLALSGDAALAYDIQVHRALELTVTNFGGLLPFPYPPPFLLVVSAFALLPFWLAYVPWIIGTIALYLASTRALVSARFAFAHPAALVNTIIGQNGFLTSAIFLSGVSLVARRPFVGGIILGLLIMKPQLAVLVPIALLASRNWRAIGAAAFSALLLLAVAAAVFGLESYRAFIGMAQQQSVFLSTREWDWSEQASIFAFLRYFGVDRVVAFSAQAAVALAAAAVAWRAWALGHNQRAGILAAATLLVPPYLLAYDSLILISPLAALLCDARRPWLPGIVWLCLFVPLFGYVGIYEGPNTIPAAAVLCLWGLLTDPGRGRALGRSTANT